MLKSIGRDNLLVMLSLLVWALGEGLWYNLRQLYLVQLGAGPVDVGTALAMENIGRAAVLLPAGYAIDRWGARQMMLASWLLGIVGVGAIALAGSWFGAALGMMAYGASAFALPAVSAYALLATHESGAGGTQRLLTLVFAAYPMGLIVSPTLGGQLAQAAGIHTCLLVAFGLYVVSTGVVAATRHFDPHHADGGYRPDHLLRNRGFLWRAGYFAAAIFALFIGTALAPNFLADVRQMGVESIGLMFSAMSLGTTLISLGAGRLPPRWGYPAVLIAVWLAVIGVWQVTAFGGIALAFLALGGVFSARSLALAGLERVVAPQDRGMAFSAVEMLSALATAAAAQSAGALYKLSPGHELPLVVGAALLPAVAIGWFAARAWRGA